MPRAALGQNNWGPLFSFLSPFPSSPLLPLPALEVGPLNTARGTGERCKLPQQGLGRSPVEIEFCTFWP